MEKVWVTLVQVDNGILSVTQAETTIEELHALQNKLLREEYERQADHEAEMAAEREAERMIDEAEEFYHEMFGRYPFESV